MLFPPLFVSNLFKSRFMRTLRFKYLEELNVNIWGFDGGIFAASLSGYLVFDHKDTTALIRICSVYICLIIRCMSCALSCHFFQSICYAIVFRNKHESKLIIFYVISNTICLNFFLGQTFRHTLYPSYKSNRGPTPDTIVQGLQYLKASIKAMSIKVIEVRGLPLLQMVRWVGCLQVKTGLWLVTQEHSPLM